jgi:hypothetical protein
MSKDTLISEDTIQSKIDRSMQSAGLLFSASAIVWLIIGSFLRLNFTFLHFCLGLNGLLMGAPNLFLFALWPMDGLAMQFLESVYGLLLDLG